MQVSCDACALINPCLQTDVELPMQLLKSELIERPQYYKKNTYACKAEPRSLVESWDDGKFQECASVIPYAVVVAGGD